MKDFRNLAVWEKAHRLTLSVYAATRKFPSDEKFGLVSQMRRAASSIPANLAEGCGRQGDADFARFVQIAIGSSSELEYFLELARDLGYLDREQYAALSGQTVEVRQMLIAFSKRLRSPEKQNV